MCGLIEENNSNLVLVADGGVKDPACAAKAFGAGADYVMMGGLFCSWQKKLNM